MTCDAMQDDKFRELEVAQQEVVALRARVHQLESDTHSASSLELKNLSLQQVTASAPFPVSAFKLLLSCSCTSMQVSGQSAVLLHASSLLMMLASAASQ